MMGSNKSQGGPTKRLRGAVSASLRADASAARSMGRMNASASARDSTSSLSSVAFTIGLLGLFSAGEAFFLTATSSSLASQNSRESFGWLGGMYNSPIATRTLACEAGSCILSIARVPTAAAKRT